MTIKAPFNFVPYSEKVFFPEWAEKVSHDIPFSDGKSGVVHLIITAKTPIFVRNSYIKGIEGSDFFHCEAAGEKRYFIPGTSIKGMIRSFLRQIVFVK